jgi:predicted transcriptional regulator
MYIKIANSELEVMRILWREEQPVPFSMIRKELECKMGWSKSTIFTFITRLRKKGIIISTVQNKNSFQEEISTQSSMLYSPAITEKEYLQSAGQNMLDKLFDGSTQNLMDALSHRKDIDKTTMDRLKEYFEAEEDGE